MRITAFLPRCNSKNNLDAVLFLTEFKTSSRLLLYVSRGCQILPQAILVRSGWIKIWGNSRTLEANCISHESFFILFHFTAWSESMLLVPACSDSQSVSTSAWWEPRLDVLQDPTFMDLSCPNRVLYPGMTLWLSVPVCFGVGASIEPLKFKAAIQHKKLLCFDRFSAQRDLLKAPPPSLWKLCSTRLSSIMASCSLQNNMKLDPRARGRKEWKILASLELRSNRPGTAATWIEIPLEEGPYNWCFNTVQRTGDVYLVTKKKSKLCSHGAACLGKAELRSFSIVFVPFHGFRPDLNFYELWQSKIGIWRSWKK